MLVLAPGITSTRVKGGGWESKIRREPPSREAEVPVTSWRLLADTIPASAPRSLVEEGWKAEGKDGEHPAQVLYARETRKRGCRVLPFERIMSMFR
jgi:hypothetical protein